MKLLFISLGCDKNLVDSEEMLGMLAAAGHEIVDDEDEAEVIIVNTCCFIGDAKEESVNTILEMAEKKKAGTCKVLIVTGCMAQRYKKEISEEIPEVDAILGTTSYGDISKAVKEAQAGRHFEEYKSIDFLPDISGKRMSVSYTHLPIVSMKVTVPDKYTGDVMGDLNKRRGRVLGMNPDHNGNTIIEADVPLLEIYGYSTDLRSMTGGSGDFSYEFARYEQAPGDIQQKEIEARASKVDAADE